MKVLEIIKKIFLGILMVAFFVFALCMTIVLLYRNDFGVTQFGNTSWVIINDDLATETYKKGDLLFVEKVKIEKIAEGDEIFAYSVDTKNVAHVNVGLVGEIYLDEQAVSYENGSTFSIDYVVGKTAEIHPGWGTFLSIVCSQWGFLFLVLVPGFLIFIYEVYALIIEVKYGDEEI